MEILFDEVYKKRIGLALTNKNNSIKLLLRLEREQALGKEIVRNAHLSFLPSWDNRRVSAFCLGNWVFLNHIL